MKTRRILQVLAAFAFLRLCAPAAEPGDERAMLEILLAGRDPQAMVDACLRLKIIGTAESVPALSGLLTDENFGHAARHALETMPCREAGEALLKAAQGAQGQMLDGLLDSLGRRGEQKATAFLRGLLSGQDTRAAASAAAALGKIGGAEAAAALKAALGSEHGAVKAAAADALLLCAENMAAAGRMSEAKTIYEDLLAAVKEEHMRAAAWRGAIATSGERMLAKAVEAARSPDTAAQTVSLDFISAIEGRDATLAFAALLADSPPRRQVEILERLAERGDAAAAPAAMAVAKSENLERGWLRSGRWALWETPALSNSWLRRLLTEMNPNKKPLATPSPGSAATASILRSQSLCGKPRLPSSLKLPWP